MQTPFESEAFPPFNKEPMFLRLQVFPPSSAYLSADPLPTGRQAVPTEGGAGRNT